mmetsp:Transcript_54347/g.151366  ORF Transcript_54347/g.151366 Transcript_54347/m.151366 type:complete len:260 (-) Transcript_54347:12-791(-)
MESTRAPSGSMPPSTRSARQISYSALARARSSSVRLLIPAPPCFGFFCGGSTKSPAFTSCLHLHAALRLQRPVLIKSQQTSGASAKLRFFDGTSSALPTERINGIWPGTAACETALPRQSGNAGRPRAAGATSWGANRGWPLARGSAGRGANAGRPLARGSAGLGANAGRPLVAACPRHSGRRGANVEDPLEIGWPRHKGFCRAGGPSVEGWRTAAESCLHLHVAPFAQAPALAKSQHSVASIAPVRATAKVQAWRSPP